MASSHNRGRTSSPKEAALQVLSLARLLKGLGLDVAILPPQLRPHLGLLRTHFSGDDAVVIQQAARQDPVLFEAACSSSAMWAANAATTTAAYDNADGKLHITVANLHTNLHRRIEADDTLRVLKAVLAPVPNVMVHDPLPAKLGQRDEGAANHMRLAGSHAECGVNVFVYGTDGSPGDPFTARQTLSASQAISESHGVQRAVFLKQSPEVIKQGVFHNDVIAVGNECFLLVHEMAYAGGRADIARIEDSYRSIGASRPLEVRVVSEAELSVEEAVKTYFFNSQIVGVGGRMDIIAPVEVQSLYDGKALRLMESLRQEFPALLRDVRCVDLRQSMNNGGGPACLRLRVPMSRKQHESLREGVNVCVYDGLLQALELTVDKHYPNSLSPNDLADPVLHTRCYDLLTELSALLRLPLV